MRVLLIFCFILIILFVLDFRLVGETYVRYDARVNSKLRLHRAETYTKLDIIETYTKLNEVENHMRRIGASRNLGIYEKSRDVMTHSRSSPGLFIGLCFDGDIVLHVISFNHKLWLKVTDHGEMPLGDLEQLTQDTLEELGTLGLEFRLVEASSAAMKYSR